ncbi:hypothetical protein FHS91_003921 [Sphingobium xanthum]|uniref:hypothetical protein n=1 Tax=Sphingobium xanthum TaxID=1387165 RepID=UPI001C8CB8FE|nr:hypothetical protein [Sphingobium xanthum]
MTFARSLTTSPHLTERKIDMTSYASRLQAEGPRFAHLKARLLDASSARLQRHRAAQASEHDEPSAKSGQNSIAPVASPIAPPAPSKRVVVPSAAEIEARLVLSPREQAAVDKVMARKAVAQVWENARRSNASESEKAYMETVEAAEAEDRLHTGADAVWARARRANSGVAAGALDENAKMSNEREARHSPGGIWARAREANGGGR